jgi:chemotaxis protein MotB
MSYAVFMTLLFAFFVVMYAMSVKDVARIKIAAQSIRAAFGGPAVAPGSSGLRESSNLSPFNEPGKPSSCPPCEAAATPGDSAARESGSELGQMQTMLEESAKLETGSGELGERMETLMDHRGLVIRLSAKDFFAHGEAAVRPDLQPLLDRIGRVVSRSRRSVRIEGYADGSELKPRNYASSWELSAARAAWVARYWIRRFKLDPTQVAVAGYAHYRPASEETDVKTEWSRAKNRRIEIVVEK